MGKGWDTFVAHSKNGAFLFFRDYMEYHANRFTDHSLVARNGGKIVAILPANIVEDTLVSHGGLTFGGVVSDRSMDAPLMLEFFDALTGHLAEQGISKLRYKRIPQIYHSVPSDEDLYALFRH